MDKALLLQRVASIRARAEAAHLEIVISSELIAQLEKEGRDVTDAERELNIWKMTEQKLLRELDWVLDELDRLSTDDAA
jgi:hypothetical protein